MAAPEQDAPKSNVQEIQPIVARNLLLESLTPLVKGVHDRGSSGITRIHWDKTLQRNGRIVSSEIGLAPTVVRGQAIDETHSDRGELSLYVRVGPLKTTIEDFGVIINKDDEYVVFIAPYSTKLLLFGFLVTQHGVESLGGPASIYNPDFLKAGIFAAQNPAKASE